jgi:hypothetical protein
MFWLGSSHNSSHPRHYPLACQQFVTSTGCGAGAEAAGRQRGRSAAARLLRRRVLLHPGALEQGGGAGARRHRHRAVLRAGASLFVVSRLSCAGPQYHCRCAVLRAGEAFV